MWLIVGGDSEIGADVCCRAVSASHDVLASTRRPGQASETRPLLDLSVPKSEWRLPTPISACCVCAAVSRLADCARDPIGSRLVNVAGTLALIDRFVQDGAYVLFLSSNQVFDGKTPQVEQSTPLAPVSEYGKQKADVEAGLRRWMEQEAPVAVLRLAKVVPPRFAVVASWVRSLHLRRPIVASSDMRIAPVPLELASQAITELMRSRSTGVYQLSGPRDISYLCAAQETAALIGVSPALVREDTAPSTGLPEGATPRYTSMNSSELVRQFGIRVPDASTVFRAIVDSIDSSEGEVDQDSAGGPASH